MKISERLSREIRKIEVRIKDFSIAETDFKKTLNSYVRSLKRFYEYLETSDQKNEGIKGEPMNHRLEITKKLVEVFRLEGKIEHEKSHLWESIGELTLIFENELQRISLT